MLKIDSHVDSAFLAIATGSELERGRGKERDRLDMNGDEREALWFFSRFLNGDSL